MDALGIERAIVGGYDWGGRAACIAAALHPERVAGLVTVDGYNVQNIARSGEPADPRHRADLLVSVLFPQRARAARPGAQPRRPLRPPLAQLVAAWAGADAAFPASAPSLHNPDFVEVVIHSYRHRYALVAGDPRYDAMEAQLAAQPPITVPTVI